MEASKPRDDNRREDWYHADRREIIRADLAARLEKICANFSDADFRLLIESMTEQKMRSERSRP